MPTLRTPSRWAELAAQATSRPQVRWENIAPYTTWDEIDSASISSSEPVLLDPRFYPGDTVPRPRHTLTETSEGTWILPGDRVQLSAGEGALYTTHREDPDLIHLSHLVYGRSLAHKKFCVQWNGEWVFKSDIVPLLEGGETWKYDSDHVGFCTAHNGYHNRRTYQHYSGGEILCREIAQERGVELCISCSLWYPAEHLASRYIGDPTLHCAACRRRFEVNTVLGHADRTANFLKPSSKDAFLYGIELEVEVLYDPDQSGGPSDVQQIQRRELAKKIRQMLGPDYVAIKHDGSLCNGFEIVTRPDSFKVHRGKWKEFLENKPAGLSSWNTRTCGMHVHMSRKPLSKSTVGKMLLFVNAADNRDFIEAIAGRISPNYANLDPNIHVRHVVCHAKEWGRYQGLNLTNPGTVELRIFRGTTGYPCFMKNLEFCRALKEWAEQVSLREAGAVSSFLRHVIKHRQELPTLTEFLTDKKLI